MAKHTSGGEGLYEFDAPSQEVDLEELLNDENDTWFDQKSGDAGDERSPAPIKPKSIVRPMVKTDCDSGPSTSPDRPGNIVTSWGGRGQAEAQPKTIASQARVQPSRVLKRKVGNDQVTPPSKKSKKSPVARPMRVLRNPKRSNSRAAPVTKAATSTEAASSEDKELERIRNLQKEVALHRKKNEASLKAALAGNPPPKKVALSTTVPKEFHFNTDTRIKATTSSSNMKEVDFAAQLRKPRSPGRPLRGATIPKPFNLSTGNKRKAEEVSAYVPMAQQIVQYQNRTPDRYHLRSRRSQARGPSPVKADHQKLTQPHTPLLMTRQRGRPATVKSSADLEAEELEKLQKQKFKALELNKKILEAPEHLKKPATKEPTVPEGFALQIEKRLQERQTAKPQEDEKQHTFKSHPLPKKILEGVVGLPERKVLPATVPESPAFALKHRVHREPRVEEVKRPSPIKAPPVPHFGLPFQPRLADHHQVEVCPFSFEERERERKALKEKRLEEQQQNEEAPKFKAQPLPDFNSVLLPEKKKLEPTKPEPFKLLIDERGAAKNSRWEQMMKQEQKEQEEAALFKARPNTVIHKEPFKPKKETRAPLETIHSSFELSTERRARERQEYERQAHEEAALKALLEEEQRRKEEEEEKKEIARLRQEQVHKAQPIRHYKPVALKKSEVPLTVPQSPNFSDRFRM